MMRSDYYILCLDTDKYAGNFERETTAYATGHVGECRVGSKQAKLFVKETEGILSDDFLDREINEKIVHLNDYGCSRPCAVQSTPGWVNDGVGNCYRQSNTVPPTIEQIEKHRDSLRKSKEPFLKQAREYTMKGLANWTQEALDIQEERYKKIDDATVQWFPAYYSVGIFLDKPLSPVALKFVVDRAKKYLDSEGVTLEGVRLITVTYHQKEETLQVKD